MLSTMGSELTSAIALICWLKDAVIVELKAVEKMIPVHEAQLLSYLKKLNKKKVGLLINFNVLHLKDGIKRMVNNL